MSEIKYDPGFPYVVRMIDGEVISRHTTISGAKSYLEITMQGYGEVIDTSPKPKIPEDAEFVTWRDGSYLPQIAQRDSGSADLGWRYGAEEDYRWYSSEALSREIGSAEVTVLVRKEDS